ncbi:unnamed protein product [Cyprideis torosa]|uniref:Uncharacterized protein n=1 Tax=Cyprideis torosa TaxID=163714 RepID=A0A7R8W6U5_9CRUS|nr:unnamed protein product [Cyprideis torosa]CAG0881680.1 unnamed protein product [Cyprideis torosa]
MSRMIPIRQLLSCVNTRSHFIVLGRTCGDPLRSIALTKLSCFPSFSSSRLLVTSASSYQSSGSGGSAGDGSSSKGKKKSFFGFDDPNTFLGNPNNVYLLLLFVSGTSIGLLLRFTNMFEGVMWFNPESPEGAAPSTAPKKDEFPKRPSKPNLPQYKLPEKVPYLLVGGGAASFAAFRAIKGNDATAKVLILSDEYHLPYMRPPLSKELWYSEGPDALKSAREKLQFKQWNGKERSVFFEQEEFFLEPEELEASEKGGLAIASGVKVLRIDPVKRIAYCSNGAQVEYERCLIATGGKPKLLPVLEKASDAVKERTMSYRGVLDFQYLSRVAEHGLVKSVTILGGGFLGSELACALGHRRKETGVEVNQIFPERGNMGKILPEYLSQWTKAKVEAEGVNVIPEAFVKSARKLPGGEKTGVALELSNGEVLETDFVVVAVGLEPNIELAETSGLEVDEVHGGFRVNAELEARSSLWVAGDAACFYDVRLGRRRVEHHDHAIVSGRLAGENMTGAGKPYWHQSMFWSDLGPEVGYEAIGIVDSHLPTVGVFAKATAKDTPKAVVEATGESLRSETEGEETDDIDDVKKDVVKTLDQKGGVEGKTEGGEDYGKGIIYYLRNDRVVGMVLWNVFNKMPIARKVIRDAKHVDELNEISKLFDLHEKLEDAAAAS